MVIGKLMTLKKNDDIMTLIRYISTLLIIITSFCAAVGQGMVAFQTTNPI